MINSPEFTIALIRTPFLPPRYASFYVPLHFNKLDLRDYLRNVYGVNVLSVRSYVEQQKITRERPLAKPGYGKLRRPQSKKRMTVEMRQPFVWPEEPKDFSAYVIRPVSFSAIFFSCTLCSMYYTQTLATNKNRWEPEFFYEGRKYSEEQQDKESPEAAQKPDTKQREAFKKQADALQGTNKQAWKPTWQVLGLNYDRTSIIKDAFKGSSSSTSSS